MLTALILCMLSHNKTVITGIFSPGKAMHSKLVHQAVFKEEALNLPEDLKKDLKRAVSIS